MKPMLDERSDTIFFYRADPDVSIRLTGEMGALLYHPDINMERHINTTGLFIWQRLRAGLSIKELVDEVTKRYSSPSREQVLSDTSAFLQDLSRQGFVKAHRSGQHGPADQGKFPDDGDAPRSFDISITGRCNLECMHCFYLNERHDRRDLETGQWLSFFEEIGTLGVQEVSLTGGEVFMRPDLWDLIDGVISKRMRYSLLTNGTLISEKTLRMFEQGRRFVRLNSIQVSIDGSCAEIHDKIRGAGAFEKAVRALRVLNEAGFPVTSRVTINRFNADDLEDIARFLLDEIGLAGFSTNEAMPMGAGCHNQDALTIPPEQELKIMRRLVGLEETYQGRITAMAGPLAKWRHYRAMEHARATGEVSQDWQMGHLTACGGAYTKLAVHHDGVISPCHLLPKLELGRINRDSVREIWKTHSSLGALKARRGIPMREVPGCEECEWASFCNGGCPGMAYETTGEFNRANPQDCYRRFLAATGEVGL